MLFVSKSRGYSITGRIHVDRQLHLETDLPIQQGIECAFRPHGLPAWAKEQAIAKMGMPRGMGQDDDPEWRLSMYDTDAEANQQRWSDQVKAEVEERLLTAAGYGQDYVLVEKPRLTAPFPAYDSTPPKRLVTILKEGGYNLENALMYERDNLNRSEVIDALTGVQLPQELMEAEELISA